VKKPPIPPATLNSHLAFPRHFLQQRASYTRRRTLISHLTLRSRTSLTSRCVHAPLVVERNSNPKTNVLVDHRWFLTRPLQVIKLMQSFTSKELVKQIFSWRYFYWYLTNEGIEYLREYLNLSADVVPNTLKKSTRPPTRPMADERAPRRDAPPGRGGGGREGYRAERPGGFGRGGGDKPQYA
jgi:hypothetical protein